jgi:pSer/pThr/pTyr-binding forkhead associated (FHA) protein
MNVSLILVQSDGKQREVPLKKSVQVIGRQTDCQIRIPSANVSRHHCEIAVGDDGAVAVRDLGSSNGTYVNKQKLSQATNVKAGDLLSLGGLVFVVKVDGKPSFVDSDDVIEDGLVEASGSPAAVESRPTAATLMAPPPKGPGSPKTAVKPLVSKKSDDSSVVDFDFLDDDEDDLKKQPKL